MFPDHEYRDFALLTGHHDSEDSPLTSTAIDVEERGLRRAADYKTNFVIPLCEGHDPSLNETT